MEKLEKQDQVPELTRNMLYLLVQQYEWLAVTWGLFDGKIYLVDTQKFPHAVVITERSEIMSRNGWDCIATALKNYHRKHYG